MTLPDEQAVPKRDAVLRHGLGQASRVRWIYIVPTLFVATLVAQIDKLSISVIMADHSFLRDMGLVERPAVVGGLVSAFLLSYGAGQFVWGPIIDRIGPRRAAMVGVAAWSVTLVWGGLSTTLPMLYLSRIFLGLSEGILYPVCNAFVARWFAVRERGRAQAVWFNGATVGAAVGGLLVTTVVVMSGWRAAFLALAVLGAVVVLPMLWFFTSDDPRTDRRVSTTEVAQIEQGHRLAVTPAERAASVFGNYRYWLLVLAFVANNIFFWGWSSWLPTYLVRARHFSFQSSGWLTGLTFAIEVVAVYLFGLFTDRLGRRAPLGALGYLLAAVGIYLGGITGSIPLAMSFLIAGVCFQQACAGNVQALLHSFSGQRLMGRAAGVLNGVANVGSFIAPALVGAMIGTSGDFSLVITALAVDLVVAAAALALLIRAGY